MSTLDTPHGPTDPDQRVGTLRGAGVDIDVRQVAPAAVGACLLALAILIGVLAVAGAQKNSRITELRQHGVPVEVTVTRCLGLLGGSGSNGAGIACRGTFTVNGHRHAAAIPGNTPYSAGDTLKGITVPGNPSLFTTPATLRGEHATWKVFILPAVLFVVLVLLVVGLLLRRRRA